MKFISKQQKNIVHSTDKYKLIQGCAGSNKTDTLIKCAVHDLHTNKRPILFLTLVGSVTDEIKSRMETQLGITIEKQKISNHYLGFFEEIPICISNYDAWVHLMLEKLKTQDLNSFAECFSEKVDLLLHLLKTQPNPECWMKNKHKVGLLLVDEAQDLQATKMEILTSFANEVEVTHEMEPSINHDMDIYIAGDYLQTLYAETNTMKAMHAMHIFKQIHPTYFDLNTCMRCPKAHVDFNNFLLHDIQIKHGIPPMLSNNHNTLDKPVLFTHLTSSNNNTNARINAEQVTNMIRVLLEKDATLVPGDIAIIMAKSRNNENFFQLEDTLTKLYESLGYVGKDTVYYMSTHGDGQHNTLDWNKAKGKTIMLSIHGDKGRGHKVVFFLGLTENSIPKESHIFKPSEIVSESLMNVGLTRSLQYLFIGFTASFPSRYLQKKQKGLSCFAYLSWNETDMYPEPYLSIINACRGFHSSRPNWNINYKQERSTKGNKSDIQVKEDLSKDFEQAKHVFMHPWKKNEKKTVFGEHQVLKTPLLQEEHMPILGIMCEILLMRKMNKAFMNAFFLQSSNHIYTDDERFLSFMYDVKHIHLEAEFKEYVHKNHSFLEQNLELKQSITQAFSKKTPVIHTLFQSETFKKNVADFLSEKENRDLPTDCVWNVTLFWNQVTQKIYRPAVNSFFGFFNEDISILHENIEKYMEIANLNDSWVLTEQSFRIAGSVSISGRYDFYDASQNKLIEIKTSCKNSCPQEWIIQCLGYTLLMHVENIHVKTICIVNMLQGCLWEWLLPDDLITLEEFAKEKMSKKYEWDNETELQPFLQVIATRRKSHLFIQNLKI
jgi:superfamily I DNA/RNA helicase